MTSKKLKHDLDSLQSVVDSHFEALGQSAIKEDICLDCCMHYLAALVLVNLAVHQTGAAGRTRIVDVVGIAANVTSGALMLLEQLKQPDAVKVIDLTQNQQRH